jgi:hypothetical protein
LNTLSQCDWQQLSCILVFEVNGASEKVNGSLPKRFLI